MSNQNESLINLLKHLNDSYKGLCECADQAEAGELKNFLIQLADERKGYKDRLQSQLNNVQIEDQGSIMGPLHRLLIDIKAKISSDNSETIKKEILRGDEVLISSYNEALESSISQPVKDELNKQLQQIHQSLLQVTKVAQVS